VNLFKSKTRTKTVVGPTLEDFYSAQATLAGVAQETPIELSRYLSEVLGQRVSMKCENLQRTGSYKIRDRKSVV
jgi:threonine dehydratase